MYRHFTAARRKPPPRAMTTNTATSLDASQIRNVCIIAHVDHGKTTFDHAVLMYHGLTGVT